jgi:hypothetical protein
MEDGRPGQDGAPTESMAAFIARRRQQTSAAAGARAAAHQTYGDAIRNGLDLSLSQPADLQKFGAGILSGLPQALGVYPLAPGQFGDGIELPPSAEMGAGAQTGAGDDQDPSPPSMAVSPTKPRSSAHPGFAESLIPVWGSGKEAYADLQDGDYVGAGINGALAVSDLFLAGDVAKAVAKGGWYVVKGPIGEAAYKQTWREVRRTLGDKGVLADGQHGHHWFIPQKGWGMNVPDVIKSHPLNIKAMPDAATHMRITGRYKGMPRFNAFDRHRYGTPTWSKVLTVDAAGHPVAASMADQKQ